MEIEIPCDAIEDYLKCMEEINMWISECCDAHPLYDLHIEDELTPIGICSHCRDNTGFEEYEDE
tara:strand:+ start:1506 stop:1697 length:192 start_codon:yes stop_codon:yes gene_type:complete